MTKSQIITLLSDFGWQDNYVGIMKGAIAAINPHLQIIDLTHALAPQNIAAARFSLLTAYPVFPQGTVHVAVVDPGVGSDRRAVAIQVAGGYLVGPDNGLFSGVLTLDPPLAAVQLTNSLYWRIPNPSATFHGRDIFAPVGAHLASGIALDALGPAIAPSSLVSLPVCAYEATATGFKGYIQYCDRFGNLITNIPAIAVAGKNWLARWGEAAIPGRNAYSDVAVGEALALSGSHGWLEIAINGGSAQARFQLSVGSPIWIDLS